MFHAGIVRPTHCTRGGLRPPRHSRGAEAGGLRPPGPFRGLRADRTYGPTGGMASGCAGWSSPLAPFDRLRLRPEAQPEGAGRSSFAGAPALSLSKRGDRSRVRGRSSAVQAMVARMFSPPLNPSTGGRPVAPQGSHLAQNVATRRAPSEGVQINTWASRPRRLW